MLFKVVEKRFKLGRTGFEFEGGLWQPSLQRAREVAQHLAPISLAHRMFIFTGGPGNSGHGRMLEEIKLPPLAERMLCIHLCCLRHRDPDRFEAELRWRGLPPSWPSSDQGAGAAT